jgi:hypothetical protein
VSISNLHVHAIFKIQKIIKPVGPTRQWSRSNHALAFRQWPLPSLPVRPVPATDLAIAAGFHCL